MEISLLSTGFFQIKVLYLEKTIRKRSVIFVSYTLRKLKIANLGMPEKVE